MTSAGPTCRSAAIAGSAIFAIAVSSEAIASAVKIAAAAHPRRSAGRPSTAAGRSAEIISVDIPKGSPDICDVVQIGAGQQAAPCMPHMREKCRRRRDQDLETRIWRSGFAVNGADEGGQARREVIEQQPDPPCGFHALWHCKPHLQLEMQRVAQYRQQFLEAPGNVALTTADSCACLQGRELREIAVASKPEIVARDRPRQRAEATTCPIVAIEADQAVLVEIGQRFGSAVLLDIIPMRIESDGAGADATGEQRLLPGTNHAHGNVRVASEQVFIAVVQRQFQRDSGMAFAKARE